MGVYYIVTLTPCETVILCVVFLVGLVLFPQLESSFLSEEESRSRLPSILTTIMDNLNSCGFCTVPIGESQLVPYSLRARARWNYSGRHRYYS